MITETKVHTCRRCESTDLVKNGHNACGSPQYLCKACGHRAVLEPKVRYPEERKAEILRAYQERPSMRGIQRTFGVSRQVLAGWLKRG